jgi:uncharacterized small protein (DUF1192 family)
MPYRVIDVAFFMQELLMEYQILHGRISELLKEIERIKTQNRNDKATQNGSRRELFESRCLRLQEIKQELKELSPKERSKSGRNFVEKPTD